MPPTVAIIMRAKNEMPHVQRTLEMLQQQTCQDFDLYAVDSGSTDGTLEALQRCCPESRLLQVAPEAYEPGSVLNQAIAQTSHRIIVLLNADAVPLTEGWLENLIAPVLDGTVDATYSRQVPRPDARFIVAYDYERAYDPSNVSTGFFSAAACAFDRGLWERFKFREQGYAEDAVWATSCRLHNARFDVATDALVEHSHNYSLQELYRKRFRHGESFARYHGERSPLGQRLYLCLREVVRDMYHACRTLELRTIPYNITYRVTIHAALHMGIREGYK